MVTASTAQRELSRLLSCLSLAGPAQQVLLLNADASDPKAKTTWGVGGRLLSCLPTWAPRLAQDGSGPTPVLLVGGVGGGPPVSHTWRQRGPPAESPEDTKQGIIVSSEIPTNDLAQVWISGFSV